MNKLYIEEIQDFLDLINSKNLKDVNINNEVFLDYYNICRKYKNLIKILRLRYLDEKLNKSIYDEFNCKIDCLNCILDKRSYHIALVDFMSIKLKDLENKINDFLKI